MLNLVRVPNTQYLGRALRGRERDRSRTRQESISVGLLFYEEGRFTELTVGAKAPAAGQRCHDGNFGARTS